MGINNFLKSLFGDKSTRDMKLIQPLVEKVKEAYPAIQALSNDELRAKTKEIQKYVQDSAKEQKDQIEALKAKIEDTPIDEREVIFNEIDKLDKEALEIYEKALDEVMPVAFSIVKETARRFAENEETIVTATDFDRELAGDPAKDFITIDGDKAIYHNHWTAGGNDLKWEMIHYDVQLFGGEVLHQGKIAEMATGEGKTLVATLPVFLNALTGNGVHVVTVNDYLAKRDSSWRGAAGPKGSSVRRRAAPSTGRDACLNALRRRMSPSATSFSTVSGGTPPASLPRQPILLARGPSRPTQSG